MFIFTMLLATLFIHDNAEFLTLSDQQIKDGYKWHSIECRAPSNNPNIHIETPAGNRYVCWQLQ